MHPGEEAGCTFRLLPDLREVRRGLHGGVGGSTAGAPDSGGGGGTDKGLTSRTRTAGMDELALSNRPNALVHRDAVSLSHSRGRSTRAGRPRRATARLGGGARRAMARGGQDARLNDGSVVWRPGWSAARGGRRLRMGGGAVGPRWRRTVNGRRTKKRGKGVLREKKNERGKGAVCMTRGPHTRFV